jgi:catechol 2,3-dioxygenase-like lactoylglutathione lyase family enzyme
MEINGVAHVMLTVSNFEACLPFYEKLLAHVGLKPLIQSEDVFYCVGGRTAVGIMRCEDAHRMESFEQRRIGLHHVCLRARERGDVDEIYAFVKTIGAKICASAGDWSVGAGILLGAVRGSGRNTPGS